jgi:hypothetical protein
MVLTKQPTHPHRTSAFSCAQEQDYLQIALHGNEDLITAWTLWCATHNLPIITLVETGAEVELLVDLSFTGRVLTNNDQNNLRAAWLRRQTSSLTNYELTPLLCHFGSLTMVQAKVLAESIQALLFMQLHQLEHGFAY